MDLENIFRITIVGNPCMQYLFLGINPYFLAVSPYISVIKENLVLKAKDISGLITPPNADIHILPSVSSFIGSDIVAGILAAKMW